MRRAVVGLPTASSPPTTSPAGPEPPAQIATHPCIRLARSLSSCASICYGTHQQESDRGQGARQRQARIQDPGVSRQAEASVGGEGVQGNASGQRSAPQQVARTGPSEPAASPDQRWRSFVFPRRRVSPCRRNPHLRSGPVPLLISRPACPTAPRPCRPQLYPYRLGLGLPSWRTQRFGHRRSPSSDSLGRFGGRGKLPPEGYGRRRRSPASCHDARPGGGIAPRVGVLGVAGRPSGLREATPQPAVALGGAAALVLAGALVVPRADASPGGTTTWKGPLLFLSPTATPVARSGHPGCDRRGDRCA